ncbi:MAG: hypothetical protein HY040_25075 [Planctomycetes bacterium]|nr:hypothetical protein [Planctomycetota bacterium]
MTRLFLASIAVVTALAVVPYAIEAQEPTPKKGSLPKSNQVYVKIIWSIDPATQDNDRPVVESWIAEQLKKSGQTKFTAATGWVPLAREKTTRVWEGGVVCPVRGVVERADGRIKVHLSGWSPNANEGVTVSLRDEPGSREIAVAEVFETEQPYVAVLIGPPSEKPIAATDHKK